MIDAFEVGYAQAQLPRGRNVPGPAIEQVLLSIVVELVTVAGDAVGIVLPDRRRAFFTPLLFDGLKFDGVDRHRVGAEVEESRLMDEILYLRQGTAVPNLAHAVHDVQYRLGT